MTVPTPDRLPRLLLDTHTLLWMVEDHPRLGIEAARTLNRAARLDQIAVSAITPRKIGVLASNKRIDIHRDPLDWIRDALSRPGVTLIPLEPEIAVASAYLPFDMHSDPADRILVATARHLGATLVTADQALLALSKKGHFRCLDAEK